MDIFFYTALFNCFLFCVVRNISRHWINTNVRRFGIFASQYAKEVMCIQLEDSLSLASYGAGFGIEESQWSFLIIPYNGSVTHQSNEADAEQYRPSTVSFLT